MKKAIVTGSAGFVGSNMVDLLLKRYPELEIVGIDNLATGRFENLEETLKTKRFKFFQRDLLNENPNNIIELFEGVDTVFHLAANADIRNGMKEPTKDIEQNIMVTHNVLFSMKKAGCKTILFTSTAPVYGENPVKPTPENAPMEIQTSLYATSKLAAEGLISSHCEAHGFHGYIFRMVSLLGPRYSHGHVIDFYRKLKKNPNRLAVLGDGTAKKSYLHVHDAIHAMVHVLDKKSASVAPHNTAVFNLGLPEYIEVSDSAKLIAEQMGLNPTFGFGEGASGWVGDIPWVYLDTSRILATGWKPSRDIRQSIKETVDYLKEKE